MKPAAAAKSWDEDDAEHAIILHASVSIAVGHCVACAKCTMADPAWECESLNLIVTISL